MKLEIILVFTLYVCVVLLGYLRHVQYRENAKLLVSSYTRVLSGEWGLEVFKQIAQQVLTDKRPDFKAMFEAELAARPTLLEDLSTHFTSVHSIASVLLTEEQLALLPDTILPGVLGDAARPSSLASSSSSRSTRRIKYTIKNFVDLVHYFVDLAVSRKASILVLRCFHNFDTC